jgi:NAD(P)-dependent dehydrogenase (short-subunit alcohol dehydrogenase family)
MSKVYFITGASSGFGAELAKAVLARGDIAVLAARRTDETQRIAAAAPERALAIGVDITDAAARQRAIDATLQRFGRIDVLTNIAGRGSLGAAEEFTEAQLREQMEINFFAAAALTCDVLPTLRRQRSGHILQLTSIGGILSVGGFAPYCASKFALEGWSEALRDEVKPLGIRVTIVEPGAFRTEFAGAKNMRPATQIDDYRPVIEPVEAYLYGNDGQQPGDPVKAAELMIAVVESDAPPLRVILGQDAYDAFNSKRAAFDAELAQWRERGLDTAHPDAVVIRVGG